MLAVLLVAVGVAAKVSGNPRQMPKPIDPPREKPIDQLQRGVQAPVTTTLIEPRKNFPIGSGKFDRGRPLRPSEERALDALKDVVRRRIAYMNAHDPAICLQMMTGRHVQRATGLLDEAAYDKCEQEFASLTGTYTLEAIEGVRLFSPRRGVVQYLQSHNGETPTTQGFLVINIRGKWGFDGTPPHVPKRL